MEKLAHIGKQLGAAFFEKALRDLFLVGLADSGACVRPLRLSVCVSQPGSDTICASKP
jgi:hypothetical protein